MRTYIVDAFTSTAFAGNPAGVCFPDDRLPDSRMLQIAQELCLSETAFVRKRTGQGEYDIRFFSPKTEIPLCGHATLASARVLTADRHGQPVVFHTAENRRLVVTSGSEGLAMEFPRYRLIEAQANPGMLASIGIDDLRNAQYCPEMRILLLEIPSVQQLSALEPDFRALISSQDGINGVLVTAACEDGHSDFHSRYFWPWSGTDEDPVTGATHTFLAGYWSDRLGKTRLRSFQASRRGGSMLVELHDDKVVIVGDAVIVLRGEMMC